MNITKSPSVIHKMENGKDVFIHMVKGCTCSPKETKDWKRSSRSWIVTTVFVHTDN